MKKKEFYFHKERGLAEIVSLPANPQYAIVRFNEEKRTNRVKKTELASLTRELFEERAREIAAAWNKKYSLGLCPLIQEAEIKKLTDKLCKEAGI